MLMDTHLIAVIWRSGKYSIASQYQGNIDQKKLQTSGRMQLVPISLPAYRDFMGIFSRNEVEELVLDRSEGATWLARLPSDVNLIFVHCAEWEHCLDD